MPVKHLQSMGHIIRSIFGKSTNGESDADKNPFKKQDFGQQFT
jgi:hypothetical protein